MTMQRDLYPDNWTHLSRYIRFERARGRCERCGAQHKQPHPITGSLVVLSTAHLDHDTTNNSHDNLMALCQLCHNRHDAAHRANTRRIKKHRRELQASADPDQDQPT